MEIHDVFIDNWTSPGNEYWDKVRKERTEPLIKATIEMTLSWNEYQELLDKGRRVHLE
jgi:hypothetical protein